MRAPVPSSPKVISIVDDDPSVGRALATLLRSFGHTVRTFTSAEAFLASGAQHESACVISDMRMPGMSGRDLQRELVAAGLAIPLIFVTANMPPSVAQEALAAGAIAVHAKPPDASALVASVEEALRRRG